MWLFYLFYFHYFYFLNIESIQTFISRRCDAVRQHALVQQLQVRCIRVSTVWSERIRINWTNRRHWGTPARNGHVSCSRSCNALHVHAKARACVRALPPTRAWTTRHHNKNYLALILLARPAAHVRHSETKNDHCSLMMDQKYCATHTSWRINDNITPRGVKRFCGTPFFGNRGCILYSCSPLGCRRGLRDAATEREPELYVG